MVFNFINNKCLTGKNNYCYDSAKAYTFRNKDLVGVDAKGVVNYIVVIKKIFLSSIK